MSPEGRPACRCPRGLPAGACAQGKGAGGQPESTATAICGTIHLFVVWIQAKLLERAYCALACPMRSF